MLQALALVASSQDVSSASRFSRKKDESVKQHEHIATSNKEQPYVKMHQIVKSLTGAGGYVENPRFQHFPFLSDTLVYGWQLSVSLSQVSQSAYLRSSAIVH